MAKTYRFEYITFHSSGVEIVNGLHYQTDVAPAGSEPAATDVLAGIDALIRVAYKNCLVSDYVVSSAELREEVMPGSGDVPVAASLVVNQPGTLSGAGGSLPVSLSATIKLRSDAAIRSGRGYMAMPSPIASSALSSSRIFTGTYFTNLGTLAALLDDSFTLGAVLPTTVNPVVYSRTRHAQSLSPYTFKVVEAIPRSTPTWRRSRMSAP